MLIEIVGYLSAGANEHRLTANSTTFLYSLLIMLNEVPCHHGQSLRVTQNLVHLRHRLLAFLNLVFIGTLFFTLFIVCLYRLQLFVVGKHFGSSSFIYDTAGDTVCHRFRHRVAVHHIAKYIYRCIDWRSCKAYVGSIGQ